MTKRLTVSALVYGDEYASIFIGSYLPSFLDPKNAGGLKDRVDFELFTDQATLDTLKTSDAFARLQQLLSVTVRRLPPGLTHDQRYGVQGTQIRYGVQSAYDAGQCWMCTTADSVFGAGVIPTILTALDAGHDSVIGSGLRTTAEVVTPAIYNAQRALPASEFFQLALPNLHPLWLASLWDSPHFTPIPYCLCWTDGRELLVRKPAIDAWVVTPDKDMLGVQGSSDMVLWRHAKNPKWFTEWHELPIVLSEPLRCFYPPWALGQHASVSGYLEWARIHIAPDAIKNLETVWRFAPAHLPRNPELRTQSDSVISDILKAHAQVVA